jgi:hypothetical protein
MVNAARCEFKTILRSAVLPVVMVLPSLEIDNLYYSSSFHDQAASHRMFVQPALSRALTESRAMMDSPPENSRLRVGGI